MAAGRYSTQHRQHRSHGPERRRNASNTEPSPAPDINRQRPQSAPMSSQSRGQPLRRSSSAALVGDGADGRCVDGRHQWRRRPSKDLPVAFRLINVSGVAAVVKGHHAAETANVHQCRRALGGNDIGRQIGTALHAVVLNGGSRRRYR